MRTVKGSARGSDRKRPREQCGLPERVDWTDQQDVLVSVHWRTGNRCILQMDAAKRGRQRRRQGDGTSVRILGKGLVEERGRRLLELRLGDAGTHCCGRRDTAGNGLEEVVHVVGARPLSEAEEKSQPALGSHVASLETHLLVSEDVAADLALLGLDDVDVGLHAILRAGDKASSVPGADGCAMRQRTLEKPLANKSEM